MRNALLERVARFDLGTADRQVCIDRVRSSGARRRQLRDVEG